MGFALIGLGNFLDNGEGVAIAAAVTGVTKESHNKIKEGVGNGPKDWTGITPNGDVIINDGYGNAVNCGPYTDYL